MRPARRVLEVVGAPSVQAASFERHLLALAGACAARGIGMDVCYPDAPADSAYRAALRDAGCSLLLRPARRWDASFVAWLAARARRAGLVHGHFEPSSYLSVAAAAAAARPVVLTRHYLAPNARRSAHGALTRTTARYARPMLAVSEPVRRSLVALGVPEGRTRTMPLGVDREAFRPPPPNRRHAARAAIGAAPSDVVVACTSHHRPGKGVDVLVEAAARLPGHVRVVAAGSGPLRADLERAAHGRVRFTGLLADVRGLLDAADVFCFPTVDWPDGLPMSVVEAMAHGLPVVATPVPAVADLVGRDAGVIVRAGDAAALASAVSAVASDGRRRAALGAAARERTRAHDLRACADAVAELYDDVLGRAA